MQTLFIIVFLLLFVGGWLLAAWLDHKHGWRLVDWMNGQCSSPFGQKRAPTAVPDNLVERVQVLEALVTEPAYNLNKEILAACKDSKSSG